MVHSSTTLTTHARAARILIVDRQDFNVDTTELLALNPEATFIELRTPHGFCDNPVSDTLLTQLREGVRFAPDYWPPGPRQDLEEVVEWL